MGVVFGIAPQEGTSGVVRLILAPGWTPRTVVGPCGVGGRGVTWMAISAQDLERVEARLAEVRELVARAAVLLGTAAIELADGGPLSGGPGPAPSPREADSGRHVPGVGDGSR